MAENPVARKWCAAVTCQSDSQRFPHLQFFPFPPPESESCAEWLKNIGREDLKVRNVGDYLSKNITLCAVHFTQNMFPDERRISLKENAVPTIFKPIKNLIGTKAKEPPKKPKIKKIVAPSLEEACDDHLIPDDKARCCLCSRTVELPEALSLRGDTLELTRFGRILFIVLKLSECDVGLQHCCVPCSKDVLTCFQHIVQLNVGAILTNCGCGRLALPEALEQGCHICGTVLPTVEEFTDHFVLHVVKGEGSQRKEGAAKQDECNIVEDEVVAEKSAPPSVKGPATSMESPTEADEPPTKKARTELKVKPVRRTLKCSVFVCSLCDVVEKSPGRLRNHFMEKHKWRVSHSRFKGQLGRKRTWANSSELKGAQKVKNVKVLEKGNSEVRGLGEDLGDDGGMEDDGVQGEGDHEDKPYMRKLHILKMEGNDARLIEDEHSYYKNSRRRSEELNWRLRQKPSSRVLCHVCGRLITESHMKYHMGYHQKKADSIRKPRKRKGEASKPTPPAPHICEHCGVEFDRKFFLVNHLVLKHDGNLDELGGRTGRRGALPPWKCGVCAEEKSGVDALTKHCQDKHDGAGVTMFSCEVCDPNKSYNGPSLLRHHMRHRHAKGPQSFLCDLCGVSFTHRSDLRIHKWFRHPRDTENTSPPANRSFLCQFCGKEFLAARIYSRHVLREHGVTVRDIRRKNTREMMARRKMALEQELGVGKKLRKQRTKKSTDPSGEKKKPRKPRTRKLKEPQPAEQFQHSEEVAEESTDLYIGGIPYHVEYPSLPPKVVQQPTVLTHTQTESRIQLPVKPPEEPRQVPEEFNQLCIGGAADRVRRQSRPPKMLRTVLVPRQKVSQIQLPLEQPEFENNREEMIEAAGNLAALSVSYPAYRP